MPILKRRYNRVLVDRPNGTLYSEAKEEFISEAIEKARFKFYVEFGRYPVQEKVVIEILGVTGAWDVSLYEIEDD